MKNGLRVCVKEPVTVDVHQQASCRGWWSHVLRGGPPGHLPARRILRGQNPEGSQARRFACGAADEVRVDDQSQDREADWSYDSADSAHAGREGDQIKIG